LKGKKLKPAGSYFFASPLYFLLVLGSLALFIGALLWTRKQEHLRQNQSLLRNRKATKVARKRLVNAEKHLRRKEQNEFYAEISQALWGYISDKFTIPKSELSFETVEIALKEKNAAVELVEQFILTLNNCEYARFAPGDVNKKMDDLYQQGIEVITKAERLIK
ncbi:MAG: protein BatD, partial [Bacteroidales bacterium]|nr:protein BatD [Bacteroidales bacterium]